MSNIALNEDDSRNIINCGLVDQTVESGLTIKVRDYSNLTDEADGIILFISFVLLKSTITLIFKNVL